MIINSLTLELHQLKKNFVRQNEVFHFNSKILNKIIGKGKVYGVKRGLPYLSMFKTLKSRKNTFVKPRKNSSFKESSSKQAPKCTTCNKLGQVTNKYFSRLFEKY